MLTKDTAADYATRWAAPSGGGAAGWQPLDTSHAGAGEEYTIPGSGGWTRALVGAPGATSDLRLLITAGATEETWVAEGHVLVRAATTGAWGMIIARAVLVNPDGGAVAYSHQTRVLSHGDAPEQGWTSLVTPVVTFQIPAGQSRRVEMNLGCGGAPITGKGYSGDSHPRIHAERKL